MAKQQEKTEMKEITEKKDDVMGQAIQAVRAGRCKYCDCVRIEKQIQVSAGFGQGMKTILIFVCGNQACQNFGKS